MEKFRGENMLCVKGKKPGICLVSIVTIWLLVGISFISIFSQIASTGNEDINSETHDREKWILFKQTHDL